MMTPIRGDNVPEGRIWAADNGCFSAPERYSDEIYLDWLRNRSPDKCLFATAPDVLGGHQATLAKSRPMFSRIRDAGYKVAFIAQNGWDNAPWDEFDAIFIGGDDAFKLGSQVPGIVSEAKSRGKWAHMGRVNSWVRLRVAAAIGCDSSDGTFLKFGPDVNAPKVQRWVTMLKQQKRFDFVGARA